MSQTTQTQPRELRRGESYQIGERVVVPLGKSPMIVSSQNDLFTLLIEPEVKVVEHSVHRQRYINVHCYDSKKIKNRYPPRLISSESVLESQRGFSRYLALIQQHGGLR